MRYFWVKIITLLIIIIYLTIRYISTPFIYYDFPCFHNFHNGQLITGFIKPEYVHDLVVFLSEYFEHSSGGGCFFESVLKNKVIEYDKHKIVLKDTNLYIDDKIVKTGESVCYNSTQIKPDNFW